MTALLSPAIALDALNFLLADVRGSLGPYVNVYLVTDHGWTQTATGTMNMAAGLAGMLFQTPIGAAIDTTRQRRLAIGLALAALAVGSLAIWASHGFWTVTIANATIATVGDVFAPAIAALSAGIVARAALSRRLGRNAVFDHAGNIAIGLLIGLVATAVSKRSIFLLVPGFAAAAAAVTFAIPARAIDDRRARGLDGPEGEDEEASNRRSPAGLFAVLRCRALVVFAVSVAFFHLANAAMLPLVSLELAARHPAYAESMVSICVVGGQAVMLPVAWMVGRRADAWGHKPIFLAAFAILPLRAILFTLDGNSAWLIGVQLLDGIGTGIYSALMPIVVAAIMRGTGRFNLAQGLVATTMGVGSALSPYLAGRIHDQFGGYAPAWHALAAIAGAGLALFAVAMPETSTVIRGRRAASGKRPPRAFFPTRNPGETGHGRPDDRQPVRATAAAVANHGAGAADAWEQAAGGVAER